MAWHDPSPHTVQFVDIEPGVRLEVLDWGGNGRPVVLLTGNGDTAHVFDEFAPKLTPAYHVYGITRRGFGASTSPNPQDGSPSPDRLGEDVIAVLDALNIEHPVLIGHSMGGGEMSAISARHPGRAAGLVYLDAAYTYAFYDKSLGDFGMDLDQLKADLAAFHFGMNMDVEKQKLHDLQDELPLFLEDVEKLQSALATPVLRPPAPPPDALASVAAYRAWRERIVGYSLPEGEIRAEFEVAPDGTLGKRRPMPSLAGVAEKLPAPTGPVLAIYAVGKSPGPFADKDPAARDAAIARDEAFGNATIAGFEKAAPQARIVRFEHTSHYVWITKETEVLNEIRTFIASLP